MPPQLNIIEKLNASMFKRKSMCKNYIYFQNCLAIFAKQKKKKTTNNQFQSIVHPDKTKSKRKQNKLLTT